MAKKSSTAQPDDVGRIRASWRRNHQDASSGLRTASRIGSDPDVSKPETFTIAEAFSPLLEHSDATGPEAHEARTALFDVERNLRAVALLALNLSDCGNADLDRTVAIGLATAVEKCAGRLAAIGARIAAAAESPRL